MDTETLLLMQENFNNIAEKLNSLGGKNGYNRIPMELKGKGYVKKFGVIRLNKKGGQDE